MMPSTTSFDFQSAVLDPRISFARAGNTATRVNSAGNIEAVSADVARFDYDPITLVCRGLLVEENRQNRLLNSETYSFQYNEASRCVLTLDAANAPSGAQTADQIANTSASLGIFQRPNTAVTAGVQHTDSFFIKFLNAPTFTQTVYFGLGNGTGGISVNITVVSGAVTSTSTSNVTVIPWRDGWYRFCCAYTPSVTNITQTFRIPAGVTMIIWGQQIETGAFATSYIPTTSAAVTRNADVVAITGTNFSDWWQASKGGVLVRARPGTVSGVRPWLQFDDGTANEIIALRGNTANPELYIVDGGVAQAQIDAGTIAANTDYSLTGWWATNDCKARLDSGSVVTDTSATIPTVTQARLGSDGTNYLNGHLASINYYDSFSEQIYTRRKNKAVFNLM